MRDLLNQEFQRFSKVFFSYTKWLVWSIILVTSYLLLNLIINDFIVTFIVLSVVVSIFLLSYLGYKSSKTRRVSKLEVKEEREPTLHRINNNTLKNTVEFFLRSVWIEF